MKNTLKTFNPATSIHISPSNHVTRGRGVDPTCRGRAEQSYKANVWMYYVNLSQWKEELGPVIKSIQDHMRADRKNGSNLLSKKKKKKLVTTGNLWKEWSIQSCGCQHGWNRLEKGKWIPEAVRDMLGLGGWVGVFQRRCWTRKWGTKRKRKWFHYWLTIGWGK